MPWNAPYDEPPVPTRLAPYANRVAELLQEGRLVGFLLVESEAYAEQLGGALWWRRWSEYRWAAHLWLTFRNLDFGIDATDTLTAPDDLDAELDDWDANRFRFTGRLLTLRWLDPDESARATHTEWDH
ncbi:hypothetical protein [Kribbella sp. NPDC055071]